MKYIGIVFVFLSCSGYRIQNQDNPLSHYGINSLAIPQFVNYSNMPEVAEMLTKNFTFIFADHRSLKLYNGENSRADATLVGIVDGPKKRTNTIHTRGTTFIRDNVLNGRQGFEVPYSASYALVLHIMIIKDAKVIIKKRLPFNVGYSMVSNRGTLGSVNFTKNQALVRQSMRQSSESLAENFKKLILDAF